MNKYLTIALCTLVFVVGVNISTTHAAFNLTGWAWSSNIGWISFSSTNANSGTGSAYGVQAATSTSETVALFSGYAWSPNIGWISFNPADVTGCPSSESTYDKPSAQSGVGADLPPGVSDICTARVDLVSGKVSGWVRVLSMKTEDSTTGWMHLSGTNHTTSAGGVRYNPSTGTFAGFAWEPTAVGWTNFDVSSAVPSTNVKLCRTGIDPNCPPVGYGGVSVSCSASPSGTVTPGTTVTFTATGSGGTAPYTYKWNGTDGTNTTSLPFSGSGYGPQATVVDAVGRTDTKSCPAVVVDGSSGISSGLKLMIGTKFESLPAGDYNDSGTSHKSVRIIAGQEFQLRWNIDPGSGFDTCDAFSPGAFSGFNVGGVESSSKIMSSSGIQSGTYNFSIMCSVGSVNATSTAKLIVADSSLEEI